jgi:hypothetical protein
MTAFQAVDKGSIPFTRIMKMFNNFKIWFGRKLVDLGFSVLLRMDSRDWNPTQNRYPGSIKQLKYNFGSWLAMHGMKLETRGLNKAGWPGYENYKYYDKNFHITKITKKRKKNNNNGFDGFNFKDFFPDWE